MLSFKCFLLSCCETLPSEGLKCAFQKKDEASTVSYRDLSGTARRTKGNALSRY